MTKRLLISLVGLLLPGALPVAAGVILITQDKATWTAAVGGNYETEDFNDANLQPNLTYNGDHGQLTVPVFSDWVARGEYYGNLLFSTPVYAAGAEWDLTPGGPGSGVRIIIVYPNSTSEVLPDLPNTFNGQFLGIVSDTPFEIVSYTGGNQTSIGPVDVNEERLTLDNLVWATAGGTPGNAVPEPGTWLLTAGALLLVAVSGRRAAG